MNALFGSWLHAAALAALCTALLAGCGDDKHRAKPPAAPGAKRTPRVETPGVSIYRKALAELAAKDGDEAVRLLEQSVRTNSRLAEAWYELGRVKVRRAPVLVQSNELAGVVSFREGLMAEKEARRLIDAGQAALWTSDEQIDAQMNLDADLQNADQLLGDPDALREALQLRVH